MLNLLSKEWKAYYIAGDEGVFELRASNSGIDKNKLITADLEKIPYITRTNLDNGVSMFVGKNQLKNFFLDPANVITIGLDTQTVFYQPYEFYTGQNIQVLYKEHLNKYTGLFISKLLEFQLKKFNWGGNGATLGRLKTTKIMLPSNIDGKPDYEFMEAYIKEREHNLRYIEKAHIQKKITELGEKKKIPSISSIVFKSFRISELLEIRSGKRLEKANQTQGKRPFIGSSDSNNGITNFVSNNNNSLDKNCLGVNYNGSVCEAFYHKYECIFSDDVKHLHLKYYPDNEYVLLFIGTLIKKQKGKYQFGYKMNESRMSNQLINVPVNANDEPDYNYMEQYIKNMEIEKYTQYLSFLN